MRVNERMKKLLSIVLTLCMVLSYIPAPAYAVGTDCTHHTKHTAECGYVEAVAGVPCAHVHDENCGYVEAVAEVLCACEATDENGAIVHTEGCGYVAPVTGAECTHVHDDACGYVAAVEGHECHYECAECAIAPANEEPGDETPVCSCTVKCGETADTNCAVCSAAGADLTACIGEEQEEPPVAATNNIDAAAMTAEELKAAVDAALAAGYTAITVNLAEDADTEMFTALRTALAESTAPDGSINLTISGAKTVPDEGFIDMLDYFDNGEKNIAGDKLKSLTLTDVETIGEYAFSACTNLEAVNMPKVVTIGEYAFNEWKKGTKLTSLDLPNATTIGVSAFAYSSLLTSVNLPKVTSIGEFAFGYCDLRTLDLPEVTTIDGEAFFNNDNLVSCSAPKATTIGFYPWGNCSRLETLELTAAGDFTLSNNLFANTPTGQINLVLHKDKESQVTQNADGTATWKTTNSNGGKLEYTFKSITFVYSIEVSAIENGAVTADKSTATEGETVTLTVTAAEGYILDTLTVMNGGIPVEVTGNSFTMPAGDVTVSATFKACDHSGGAHTSATDLGDGKHSFTCSVCDTSVTEPHSIGADGKCVCGLTFWTVEGNTLTIDGTLGGKTTAEESDITALLEAIKGYVDSGITTIIVTGSKPAKIEVGSFIMPAVSEALYRLTNETSDSPYCGTIDLILPDVTEIVDDEFNNTYALNSITLPKVTTVGDGAFYATGYLQTLTFGSVITFVNEESSGPFHMDGYYVGGCDLVLNCGQLQAEEKYKPNLETNVWFVGDWSGEYEWKSITLTHTEATAATCIAKATCSVCDEEYGEVDTNAHSYGDWDSNGDGTHTRTCAIDPAHTESGDCSGGTATCTTPAVCDLCGESYGELGSHSFDDESKCAVCGTACTHKTFTDGKCPCGLTGGYCGAATNEGGEESVIWTYDEETGAFTVSGSGAMKDYNAKRDRPWDESISKNATSVTISEGVTRIGKLAFHTFTQITAVTVPASVESIGYCAFTGCKAMQSITFAEGSRLTAFDYYVFQNCTALKQITLPAGVTSVDPSVFSGCDALTDIFVEEGSTTLKDIDGVLYTADGTTLLRYPIGKKDTAFTTPAGVTIIGEWAFQDNVNLETITISEGVTTIGEDAFTFCLALETLNLPDSLTTMGICMIAGSEKLTSIALPETLTKIDEGAFACSCLTEIHIPKNVTTIGAHAFEESHNLTTVVIPQGVTTIGEQAFWWMESLTTVTIPSSVTSIGRAAFQSCDKLTTINAPCNWDTENPLYTFDSTVAVIVGDHTPNADGYTVNENGTHSFTCDCGTEVTEEHTGGTATCNRGKICDLCGTEYGELDSHSFDSAGTCTGCQIKAKAKLEAFDFELDKYVPTYYATLPEALAAVTQRTSQVVALADYDGVLELTIDFDGNGYTFSGEITVDEYATIQDGNFTGKVILNYGNIWDGTFQGEVIVKADGYIQGGTFHNTVTVETGGTITGMASTFKGTVINNGSIYAGNFYSDVTNNGKIYRDELDVSVFYGTLTNNGTIYGGYFIDAKLINAGTVENHCSDSYDYVGDFEYVPAEGGTVTGDHNNTAEANCTSGAICSFCGEYGDKNPNNHASDIYTYTDNGDGTHGKVCTECGNVVASEPHTLTYTASGNVITATCSANCGYSETATISAENATYNGTEQTTASIAYSEGWTGGEPTVSYENNVNAGTATASITLGEATASVEFTIAKAEVNLDTLVDPEFATGLVYNGTAQALVIKTGSVEGGTILYSLTYDGEYTSTIPVATEAGRYGVYWLIQGDENHEDILSPGWTQVIIAAKPGTDANVTLGEYDSVYSGTAKEPGIASVVVDGVTLTAGKDYDVSYENNVYAGTAKAVITFKGNYSGTVTETFQISKAPLTVTADDKSMTTGRDLPAFTYTITGFVNGETEAVLTTKPTVSCEADGQTAGTYDITVSGAEAANYDITHVNGTLSVVDHQHAWTYTADGDTITAKCGNADTCPDAEQTIKIAAEGKTYDGTPVTATLTGNIDGVDTPAIRYFKNGTELNESVINAGTYTASITLGEATASVEFTIAKAEIDGSTLINPEFAEGLIYNGTAQALVTKIGSVDGGYIVYSLSIDGEYTTTIPVATEAGTYRVYWTIECDENHYVDGTPGSSRVTIAAKAITVTADAVSKTYGDTDPTLTYKVEGLVNGDELTGELKRVAGENVGSYAIEQNTLTAGNNYSITYTGANLTINAKAITEADVELNGSLTYTGEEQTQPITVTEGITYEVTGNKATNTGAYELTVKGTGNYTGEVKLNWSIKEAAAVVGKAPTAKELTYTGTAQALVNAGTTADGKLVYSLSENGEFTESIPTGTNAGEYTVWYYVQGDDNHSDTAKASVKVTIAKADPVIGTVGCEMALFDSIAISNVELTRTDMSVEGTLVLTDSELTAGEGTYNWKFTPKDTDNYNTITGTVVLNVTADVLEKIEANGNLEKDSYSYGDTFSIDGLTVTATYTTGATKDVTELVSFDSTLAVGQTSVELTYQGKTCTVTGFTVAKKQLVIDRMAWDIPENAVYNGTEYTATLNGTLPTGVVVTLSGDKATNAGSYTAKAVFSLAEGYSADNYEIVNGEDLTADWTIAKKNIVGAQITLGTALTYNGKQQTQTVTKAEIDGLTVTYTVSGNTGTDAKDYTLTITGNGNFEGTETKEWSIAKKNISGATITLGDSLTYNGTERTQEVTDVKIGDLTVTYDVTANKQLGAGNYTLTVTGNGNFEGSVTADWSIAKAKLTITANNNSTTYGDVPAANGVTGTGFVSSESIEDLSGELTYSYNYEQFGNVGTYKITPSGVTSNNYEITFADGTLTVDAKPITVTADAVSKTYGEADPALTYKVEGLVNGDELTGELNRVAGENVGGYAIEQNTLTAGNNYRLTYTGAELTINAKAITEADVELNGSLTYNGKEQTQPITVTEGITYEVSGNKATNAGAYELTVKGTGNYTGSVTLDWTIAKAKLTITADSKVIYIGEKVPTLTYTTSGLVGGDKLTKEPVLTTNADADQAGSYTITAANADAGDNYTITYVNGSLTIMDKETEVETKIEQTELTEVPEGLKDTQFDTVEEIKEELISKILATSTGYSAENMVHYDVALHFSLDGGDSWVLATEENFPTEGITVILPYPEGTNARDYEFVVSHMFAVTSQRLGTVAGEVEMPKVEETANGIRVTLNGLSPVTVAARYHDHTGGTATCTEKAVCTICGNAYGEVDKTNHAGGTEVKDAKEATCGAEGYTGDTHCKGCGEIIEKGAAIKATGEHTYGDWKVVKEPTKTTKGEKQRTCSVCGHVDSKEIPVLSDTPATGDDSNIMLYSSMFTVSLAGLVVLLLAAKKRKQENA